MMKFAPIAILLATFAAATPVPEVEWVTVTRYTTVFEDSTESALALWPQETSAYAGQSLPYVDENWPDAENIPYAEDDMSYDEDNMPYDYAQMNAQADSAVTGAFSEPSTPPAPAPQPEDTHQGTKTGPSGRSVVNSRGASPTSSAGDGVFAGQATYYNPGMGACGMVSADSDFIVAVGDKLYESYTPGGNPNENTLCGAKLIAHYEGKSVEVTVVDRCGSCSPNDLDLSPVAFAQIADQGLGRINLTWEWA
ncbi:hypothetical protein JCM33374_g1790 [Metschnikowia sp. JCM 33374]|nr:hypothetical protein JCM33374_g1790 [Metschnikowia sp. JCM 33374]